MVRVRNIGMSSSREYRLCVEFDVQGFTFDIFRSYAPHADFIFLGKTNVPFFIDEVNLYDEGNKFYYYVVGKNEDDEEIERTEVATLQHNKKDLIANKVMKEIDVVLRVMKNPPSFLLIARREGTNCPNCWNPVTNRIRFADCPICYGTGKIKGYFPPVPIKMSTDMSQYLEDTSFLGDEKVSISPVNAWVANYPLVTPGDIVVDVTDRRFIVTAVIPRTKSQYIIRQIIQLTPIEKGHPAYNVLVNRGDTIP